MTLKLASAQLVEHSGPQPLTLNQLMDEVKRRGERGRDRAKRAYERTCEYYNSLQVSDNPTANDSDSVDPPRRNVLRNLARTQAARYTEARNFAKVWPGRAEARAMMAAEAANALLKHQRHLVHFDLWSWDVCIRALQGGRVGVIPYWDETRGSPIYGPAFTSIPAALGEPDVEIPLIDEDGDQVEEVLGYEGEVVWRILEPTEYVYWPVPRDRDLRTCKELYLESEVDEHEAYALLDDDEANIELDVDTGRAKVREIWCVPCRRIPKGLHAVVVGDYIAEYKEWDLPFARIPLAEFGLDPIPGTQYFSSVLHDAVDTQRMINDKEAAKFATVRRTGFPVGIGRGPIAEQVYNAGRGGPGRVSVDNVNDVTQGFRWIDPPPPHPLVFETIDEDVAAMYDMVGVSEVSSGQEAAKAGTSARGIAYMDHLDAQKISGDVRAFERFNRDLFLLTLELYLRLSGRERRIKVFGADGAVKEYALNAADLDGYDLVFEPTDGKMEMHASVATGAEAQMQTAGPVPELLERAQTGLGQSSGTVDQRVKLADMAQRAMRGEAVQPDQSIPPGVALAVLRVFQGERGVDTLIAGYEQLSTQQAASGEFGGATPGPRPGAPQNRS